MTAAPTPANRNVGGKVDQLELEGDTAAVIVIDVEAAEILAASPQAFDVFGFFPYASFPIALDPASPALVSLRDIAARGGVALPASATLTFWCNGGEQRLRCALSRRGNGGSHVFMVRVISDGDVEPATVDQGVEAETNAALTVPADDEVDAVAKPVIEAEKSAAEEATPESLPPSKSVSVLDPDHLAKLAHELKTPLTAIAAAAEVMRDERLGQMGNARYLSYAADIHENAVHALDLVTSLLSEGGRPAAAVSRLIPLDLNAIVARTVSSVQALAQSRSLDLAFDADSSHPHVIANPTAIRQILLNLLTNAIKFTPPEGEIRVITGYLKDARVFMLVRDTGCGIGAGVAPAGGAASEKSSIDGLLPGHGIGLPLVRRLVREMEAEIEIDSAPNKGTAVLIAFAGFARWPT